MHHSASGLVSGGSAALHCIHRARSMVARHARAPQGGAGREPGAARTRAAPDRLGSSRASREHHGGSTAATGGLVNRCLPGTARRARRHDPGRPTARRRRRNRPADARPAESGPSKMPASAPRRRTESDAVRDRRGRRRVSRHVRCAGEAGRNGIARPRRASVGSGWRSPAAWDGSCQNRHPEEPWIGRFIVWGMVVKLAGDDRPLLRVRRERQAIRRAGLRRVRRRSTCRASPNRSRTSARPTSSATCRARIRVDRHRPHRGVPRVRHHRVLRRVPLGTAPPRRAVPTLNRKWYSAFMFFAPSLAFWPSSVGKEAIMLLALGLAALGTAKVLNGRMLQGFLHRGARRMVALDRASAPPRVRDGRGQRRAASSPRRREDARTGVARPTDRIARPRAARRVHDEPGRPSSSAWTTSR